MTFQIIAVETAAEHELFLDVPERVYTNDCNWVAPLRRDIARKFAPNHPFLRHGKLRRFIAVSATSQGQYPVGRVVAGIDYDLLEEHGKVGFVGFFEAIDDFDVASGLLERACLWLQEQGMEVARNSIGHSDSGERFFFESLLLVEGYDSPPMVLMPYNPPYYAEFFERAGWQAAQEAYSYSYQLDDMAGEYAEILGKSFRQASEAGITFRSIDTGRNFTRDCEAMYELAFERLRFEGPHREEFMQDIKIVKSPIGEPDACILAEKSGGELVGVLFCLPDYYMALRHLHGRLRPLGLLRAWWQLRSIRQGRVVLIGVLPAYRRQGGAMALLEALRQRATVGRLRRYQRGELSWIYADNLASRSLCEIAGAEISKTYRIYEKSLL
jgi:GNAT superfamily N-acetyltransferase